MATPLYSTSVQIDQFNGLNQIGDGYNMNMRYAREMENVDVSGGSFKPMREGRRIAQTLDHPIGTLAFLHRRYGATAADRGTVLVAISDGKVYTKTLDGDDSWVQRFSGLTDNDCDWVTYEVNERNGQRTSWPVDILLFTNSEDGMYVLYGDDLTVEAKPVLPDPEDPDSEVKFGVLARYNERIWGAGIEGDPDKLMYSVPYEPFNWTQNTEIPEDGAGDILQPTWDGDYFVSLRQYGSDLLSVKRNSIWRIYGTNPGEFSMQRQYGGGTIEENTFTVYNQYAYMLGEYGLMRYDGTGAYPYQQEAMHVLMRERVARKLDTHGWPTYVAGEKHFPGDKVLHDGLPYRCRETTKTVVGGEDVWDMEWVSSRFVAVDPEPIHNACAGMWNTTYCLALPLDGSDRCNAILQYDTATGAISLRTGVTVDAFLQINERLFYTSADYPGVVYEMDDTCGEVKNVKWVSGFQDLGLKSSIKNAFTVYMMVETEAPLTLMMGIRTEKKLKRKEVKIRPGKLRRINLNNHGREFRLEIESLTAVPFTIAGGIKIDLELDPD